MKPYVAVAHPFQMFLPSQVKRTALLFDRIAMVSADSGYLRGDGFNAFPEVASQLAWLIDNGIAFEPPIPTSLSKESDYDVERCREHVKELLRILGGSDVSVDEASKFLQTVKAKDVSDSQRMEVIGRAILAGSYIVRIFSTSLCSEGFDSYPVLLSNIPANQEFFKSEVIRVVFNELPMPDEQTPWEQILEFRGDPDSKAKFLDLRHWMSEIARDSRPRAEMEETLEYLMSQYQRHMALHKMKTTAGVLETTVVSTGEIIENLVRMKWGKVAKMLFSLKARKITLLEGELTSPGSEVAYIIKANETFAS